MHLRQQQKSINEDKVTHLVARQLEVFGMVGKPLPTGFGAGVDTSVIAIWLGHESVRSTDPYLHADMAIKQRALERIAPPTVRRGRYQPPDHLLAFLESL